MILHRHHCENRLNVVCRLLAELWIISLGLDIEEKVLTQHHGAFSVSNSHLQMFCVNSSKCCGWIGWQTFWLVHSSKSTGVLITPKTSAFHLAGLVSGSRLCACWFTVMAYWDTRWKQAITDDMCFTCAFPVGLWRVKCPNTHTHDSSSFSVAEEQRGYYATATVYVNNANGPGTCNGTFQIAGCGFLCHCFNNRNHCLSLRLQRSGYTWGLK